MVLKKFFFFFKLARVRSGSSSFCFLVCQHIFLSGSSNRLGSLPYRKRVIFLFTTKQSQPTFQATKLTSLCQVAIVILLTYSPKAVNYFFSRENCRLCLCFRHVLVWHVVSYPQQIAILLILYRKFSSITALYLLFISGLGSLLFYVNWG